MNKKKRVISFDAPIDTFFEYQFVMESINEYLKSIGILEMKPKVSKHNKEYLQKLNIITYKNVIEAKQDVVTEIYNNKKLFRFLLEAFSFLYLEYERSQKSFAGKRAISILCNAEKGFLEKPINMYLAPKMYVRMCKATRAI